MLLMFPPACSTQRAVPVLPVLIIEESSTLIVPPSTLTVAMSSIDADEPKIVAPLLRVNVAPSPTNIADFVVASCATSRTIPASSSSVPPSWISRCSP